MDPIILELMWIRLNLAIVSPTRLGLRCTQLDASQSKMCLTRLGTTWPNVTQSDVDQTQPYMGSTQLNMM